MRTSSISPANHSPQMALPPIFNAPVETTALPVWVWLATSTPLTYRRITDPL